MEPLRPAVSTADPREALERKKRRQAIQGFEEMFIAQMLVSMRKTVPVGEESNARALWRERFDAELARLVAESGGIGLSSLVEKGIDRAGRGK